MLNLMVVFSLKLYYFSGMIPPIFQNKANLKFHIKIPFFRVLVTIEPSRSLLHFVTTNCLTVILLISTSYSTAFMIQGHS